MSYSPDEVLILGGEFADGLISFLTTEDDLAGLVISIDDRDDIRNAIADAVEPLIRNWTGRASVPLPKPLQTAMLGAGRLAAINRAVELGYQITEELAVA